MSVRLRPAERDLFLTVVDMLAAGTVMLRGRVLAHGFAASVTDVLFDVAARGAGHRLPAMVTELLVNLYRLHPDDAPVSYDAAARVILLEHGAVEIRRAEQAEDATIAADGAAAKNRKLRNERRRTLPSRLPVRLGLRRRQQGRN